MAKPIFVGGTASHVGKSWMVTAICAWLKRNRGTVAPFKAQNMSNNSYPCAGGGEIGRAQVVQAAACGLDPETDMNPVLLKPGSDVGSQVVLHGRVWRNTTAATYYGHSEYLFGQAREAYDRLASRYEYVVLEGAGSIAELNLKDRDFTNLRFAEAVSAPSLLVADIDRGGVFGSLVGTVQLLDATERQLVRAFAINRFRGDSSLFRSGVELLEQRLGLPCLGVFPHSDIEIEAEDGVSLDDMETPPETADVAIIRLPHISNFTDFRLLPSAIWLRAPVRRQFKAVIVPGTKSTIADLAWLRQSGLAAWLCQQLDGGARVLGVCGGYQMLGESISDPHGVEGIAETVPGIGLLPVVTELEREKVTRRVHAITPGGAAFSAYEIHMGVTTGREPLPPFARFPDGSPEGVRMGAVAGTYLHGALEHPSVLCEALGVAGVAPIPPQKQFDRLAEWFASNADLSVFEREFL
jgi:adenosylcobyric acid synthase